MLLAITALGSMLAIGGSAAVVHAAACGNESLRLLQDATMLEDCRAWEMISPVDKKGADVSPGGGPGITAGAQAGVQGGAVVYSSPGAFGDPVAGGLPNYYLGSRQLSAWSNVQVNVHQEPHQGLGYASPMIALSPDLSKSVIRSNDALTPGAPQQQGIANLYLRDNASGALKLITPAPSPVPSGQPNQLVGASADFSRILFQTTAALTPGATEGVTNLYLWVDGPSPEVRLVASFPGGAAPAWWSNGLPTTAGGTFNVLSEDGTRVLYVKEPSGFEPIGPLWMAEEGQSPVEISASRRTSADPNGPQQPMFGATTPDQEYVFFTSGEKLTDDATTGPASTGSDLYRYQSSTGELVDLTVADETGGSAGAEVRGAAVQQSGVLGVSNDGSHVYFTARGVLAPGATEGGENIYLWQAGEIAHVATGQIADNGSSRALATVSPNGRYLVFLSADPLTGLPNEGHLEAFRYDAETDALDCVSCPAAGAATADVEMMRSYGFLSMDHHARRFVTDGGSVFFSTAEALAPQDTNGVMDAYEFSDRGVALISSGRSDAGSNFYDASPDGSDVYFSTREQLVSQDVDALMDIYDARVEGGLAQQNSPPAPPPCAGEGCRPLQPAAPAAPSAGSSTLVGPGNPQARRKHKKNRHCKKKRAGKQAKKHCKNKAAKGARRGR